MCMLFIKGFALCPHSTHTHISYSFTFENHKKNIYTYAEKKNNEREPLILHSLLNGCPMINNIKGTRYKFIDIFFNSLASIPMQILLFERKNLSMYALQTIFHHNELWMIK
jgi:hypothetical protein